MRAALNPWQRSPLYRASKRALDVTVAGLGLLFAAPLLLPLALALRISLGRSPLFRQQRPGLYGRPFMVVKLATMSESVDALGELLPDEQRLTRLGSLVRRLSLDELPQLWNVLQGDMSLVGPRPLLMEFLPRYTPEQARRHDVPPGITGWAQIQGRLDVPTSERISRDVWYVDHCSFWLDLRILLLSVPRVVMASGSRPVDDLGWPAKPN